MNFIKDDDQCLLNPNIHYVKIGNHTRQFVDWNMASEKDRNHESDDEFHDANYYDENYEDYDDEQSCEYYQQEDGNFFHIQPVPSELIKHLIGRNRNNLSRIEKTSKCKIKLPNRGEDNIRIIGSKASDVDRCKTLVELTLEGKRWLQAANYFLSFSLTVPVIQASFIEFKKHLLLEYPFIDQKLFQSDLKLHLTIGMVYLLSDSEVKAAIDIMNNKIKQTANNIIADNEVSKIEVGMKGIEIMNDDPYMTDIVYAKIEDSLELIQVLSDETMDIFVDAGYSKKEYNRTKLHCTIMNSLFAKDKSAKETKRNCFSAAEFMKNDKFLNWDFGKLTIDTIHLNKRFEKSEKDGYYNTEHSISF